MVRSPCFGDPPENGKYRSPLRWVFEITMVAPAEKRFLVIDDDEQVHHLFQFCFSGEYDFHFAFSGEEALNLVEQREYPVVTLDLNLSGKSGLEILPALRGITPCQKIIVLTGHASKESAISAVNHGAFKYIEKPFTHSEMKDVIEEGFESYFQERFSPKEIPASLPELARLGLSPREAEIANWVLQGESNQEIANRLALSHRTIEKYLETIFSKLNVHSRMKLAPRVRALRAVIE